jgi:ATP-binding cassette, subfamily C (CFTR/MRP), member 1
LETLSGLATIRAFSWQNELVALAQQRLDYSQKPLYLLFSIQRWLSLVLDLLTAGLAITLVSVAVGLRGRIDPGFAGLALFNVMGLSSAMKAAVYVWTILETSIGAVARIKSFEDLTPSEQKPEEQGTPPEDWPSQGNVKIRGLTASYKEELPSALSNVSLDIKAGEKIGICGRSGR